MSTRTWAQCVTMAAVSAVLAGSAVLSTAATATAAGPATMSAAPTATAHSASAPTIALMQSGCSGTRELYGWHYGTWWPSGGYCYYSDISMGWFQQNGRWVHNWHRGWTYGSYHVPV